MPSLILATLLLAQAPAPAAEPLAFDVAALKARPRVEVRVREGEKTTVYAGVPLGALLEAREESKKGMAGLRSLADAVLLVKATDDYQAAVSAAAAAMDKEGRRYLLAFERDGKPLDAGQGPVKLIVPDDPQHVRWVRMVSGVDLIRLPKPALKERTPAAGRDRR